MTVRRGAIRALPPLALAAVGVVVATTIGGGGGGGGARATGRSLAGTAVVSRRTLVDRQRVDGTLGYSGSRAATNRLTGTITWLPHAGAVIRPGGTLFEVDGHPVVLMDGSVPAYRTLNHGVSDGPDVRQLERGLASLGFDPGTIDGHYDATTAAAVRAWQGDRGLPRTGSVELGRVVFLPGARRVTDVKVSLGSTAGGGGNGNGSGSSIASLGTAPSTRFVSLTTPDETSTTPTDNTPTTPTTTTPTPTTPIPTPTSPGGTPSDGTGGSGDGSKGRGSGDGGSKGNGSGRNPPKGNGPASDSPKSSTPASTSPTGNGSNPNGSNGGDANAPATDVLMTSSTRRVVTAKLDAADQTLAARGRRVRVELPTGRVVAGRIVHVGTVATTDSGGAGGGGGDGSTTIPITIRLRSARAAGRLDQAPVSVQIARTTRRNVLAVPVQALVARAGGRYAVELGDGRLAGVTPGMFADGYVEIVDGAVRAGDRVRVPR